MKKQILFFVAALMIHYGNIMAQCGMTRIATQVTYGISTLNQSCGSTQLQFNWKCYRYQCPNTALMPATSSATIKLRFHPTTAYGSGSTLTTINTTLFTAYNHNVSQSGYYWLEDVQATTFTTQNCCGNTVSLVETFNNWQSSAAYIAIQTPASANFNINGVNVSATSPYEGYGYNCPDNALILNNTSTGNMNNPQWQLYYQECNSTGGGLTGSTYPNTITWSNGWPAVSTDMKTYSTDFLGSSAAVGKYYLITLKVKNGCNGTESVKQGLAHINSAPSIPVSGMAINNPVSGIPCYSSSPSSPCTLCTGSPTMNVTSSTGLIFYYSKVVQQNISGTWTTVYNSGNVGVFGGVGGLTGLYVAYNGFSWSLGGSYRVTFTVGNQCGSDSKTCYFTPVSCKTDGEELLLSTEQDAAKAFLSTRVFPNPVNHMTTLYLSSSKGQSIGIGLYDIEGRLLKQVSESELIKEGDNFKQIDASDLANGVYLFKIEGKDGIHQTVRFVKQ
jgi:hypothetical protein